jgi:hypothetical protein
MRAQYAAHQGRVNGGRSAFPADIADHDPQARTRVMHKIVKISADGARRNKFRRYLQILELRHRRRQQPELQFARQRQIAFQPPLLPRDLFVQARILECDGHLCG